MPTVYVETEVDVDLEDFNDDDLIDELERRGLDYNTRGVDADHMRELLESIWFKRRNGNTDYQCELDALIWGVLGRVV